MHPDDLKRLFPNASASTLARNASGPPRRLVPDSKRQQDSVDESVAADAGKAFGQSRVRIVVTSYRSKLLDEDNIALGAKPLIDCVVAAGIIPSDSSIWCKIEHRQELTWESAQERTEIEVIPL